jgi:pSer/pThr/pTyr-binding forkhead associated (FHA) protein
MAFIEYGGSRHVIPAGEMLVGTGADCHLRLEGPGIGLRHAVLTTAPDQSVSIRGLPGGGDVEVNGVRLGPLPQSLLHGDKVTIGSLDLLFVDERKSGSTQYVSAVKLDNLGSPGAARPGAAAGQATAATGGRVVSLTDGREYQVIGGSLKFGRDANSDVVVSGGQVSRRHCEIVVTPRGYVLVDSSTNGAFVNGERVQNQRLLARADVIRLGEEEFRFYADVAKPPVPVPSPVPPPPAAAPSAPPAASPASVGRLASTGYFASPGAAPKAAAPSGPVTPVAKPPAPAVVPQSAAKAPAPPAAPVAAAPAKSAAAAQALAKFVVRSGSLKGQRLYVRVPIVNIGRAEYNDLVIPDDSVSSQHAKLTRREGVWVLTDLGSTNGTMVDGEPFSGDMPIAPGAFVRFGEVQLVFEPTDDDADINSPKGTRMVSALKLTDLKPPQGR